MASDNQALLLQVSADLRKLEKNFDKAANIVDAGSKRMEKRAKEAGTSLERFFGKTDGAKALDKIFDSTRFKVLDSGVARIGLFGSALESLGPAGLIAAAGLGAFGAALAGAREAAKFADDISDTANRLHVTTDALQEYRYAIRAAGGEEKGADEALENFSVTLGKAQAGLTKSQRAFLQLGFTKEQIKGFTDADTALKAVVERIAGLSDVQKDAVIQQLGLDGIKPLIEDGVTSMQRLREEAHKVGVVMDADLVKRGGELNDQFETVSKVIDIQLKSALVDLGPILVGLLGLVADLAKAAASVADAFRSVQNKTTEGLQRQLTELKAIKAGKGGLSTAAGDFAVGSIPLVGPQLVAARQARRAPGAIDGQIASLEAELRARAAANAAKPVTPTRSLIDTSNTGGGRKTTEIRDNTAQRVEQVNAALANSGRDLLQSMLGLTDDVEARAAIEREIADEEAAARTAQINKQIADIKADEGIKDEAVRRDLVARLEIAKNNEAEAAAAKQRAITRDAAFALEDRQIEIYRLTVEAQLSELEAAAGIATTAKQRGDIEKRILDLRQQLERDLEGTRIDRAVKTGALSPEQAQKEKDALGVTQSAAQRTLSSQNTSPVQSFIDANTDIAKIAEDMETSGVRAFESLADGLADAIVNAHSLGDVAKNVFRQLIADILSQQIKSAGASLVAAFIPGFASGTNFAPGGLALVGERGPELVKLPRGSQITPSDQTLKALSNLSLPKAAQAVVVHQSFGFDLRGAVTTDDLLKQMNVIAARQGAQARALGARDALRAMPERLKSFNQRGA